MNKSLKKNKIQHMTFTFSNDQEPLLEESGPDMDILDTSEHM